MKPLKTEFLMTLRIEVAESHLVGETPAGFRRIDVFGGGSFEGPKLKGRILSGGVDMLLRRKDGALQPDVRLTLETDDKALIFATYRGYRHGPPEVMEAIARGEMVPWERYYLRNAPFYETASAKYDWLNRVVSVGVGHREPKAAIYDIHEVL